MARLVKLNLVGVPYNYDIPPSEKTQLLAVKDSMDGEFSLSRFSLLFLASLTVHGSRATDFFPSLQSGVESTYQNRSL